MYRLLTRDEVVTMLAPYGAAYMTTYEPGSELWRTAEGAQFLLTTEYDGMYHEFMVLEAVRHSIQPDRPE